MTEFMGSIVAPGPLAAKVEEKSLEERLEELKREIIDMFESMLGEYIQQVEINEEIQNYFDETNITNIIGKTYKAGTGIEIAGTKIHQYVIYRAVTTAAAGAGTTIAANIYDRDLGTVVGSGFGFGITVNCSIVNGTALNAAIPRLESGDEIYVAKLTDGNGDDAWYCLTVFQTSEDCTCVSP